MNGLSLLLAIFLALGSQTVLAEDEKPGWYETEARHLDVRLYENLDPRADSLDVSVSPPLRFISQSAFFSGEKLVFSVRFGILRAGVAILEIPEIIPFRGDSVYRVVSKAISNGFVSTFYPVRDIVMSLVSVQGLYPVYFEKHLKEGGYHNDYQVYFDQKKQTAHYTDTTFALLPYSQDILSVFYYLRALRIEPGSEIMVDSHTDRVNYPLKIQCHKREKVKVPAGEFSCVVVEPFFRVEGLFKKKGNLQVWLTDDERHLPVKMKSKIYFIGSVSVDLISFQLSGEEK